MSFLSTGKAENSAPQHIDVKITPSVDHGGYLIEIPPTLFVRAGDIPNWIADALVPELDAVPTLCVLQKTVLVSEGHWMHSELSSADYALLDEIADGISRVSGSTTQAEWALIREAFENAPNKPSWGVLAQFTNPREGARVERSNTRHSHFDQLDAAIQRGQLAALTAARLPARKLAHDTLLSFSDAQAYLKPLGFHLQARSLTVSTLSDIACLAEQQEEPSQPTDKPMTKWDEYELRRLLNESHDPEMTQEKLGKKYGVTRQRVAVLLKRATDLVAPKKAGPFDGLGNGNRKK